MVSRRAYPTQRFSSHPELLDSQFSTGRRATPSMDRIHGDDDRLLAFLRTSRRTAIGQ